MGPIVDIVKPLSSGDAQDAQFFAVNVAATAPPSVPIHAASCLGPPANVPILYNSAGQAIFQPKDAIRVLSFGVVLPYQFTLASMEASVRFRWWNVAGTSNEVVDGFGPSSSILLPFENSEISLDVLIGWPDNLLGGGTGARLSAEIFPVLGDSFPVDVSMVGVPASLDTLSLPILPFFKILHNLKML
jgi:hypothetical protein